MMDIVFMMYFLFLEGLPQGLYVAEAVQQAG